MKYLLPILLLAAIPAQAQTSAAVSLTSDYVARGTSQTYNKPAATLFVETVLQEKFYIGGFAANVDFDEGTQLEADVMAGYRTNIGKTNIDVGAMYITYHGTQTMNWNMVETHVSANRQMGPVSGTVYVGVSPNYFNYAGRSVWSEVSLSANIFPKTSISAAAGYQYIEKDKSYATWNIGGSYDLGSNYSIDARYYDTDWTPSGSRYLDKIYAPRVVVSLRKGF